MANRLSEYYGKDSADEAKKKAEAEAARVQGLINSVPVAGNGPVTFADIDKWIAANPTAQYFRIGNDAPNTQNARSYTNEYGTWADNYAAIVSQDSDKGARDIFRYMNISAATPRQGKRGEKATIGMQYQPGEFFAQNNIGYKSDYGQIYSLKDYGSLKEQVKATGQADWLTQYEKQAAEKAVVEGQTQEGQASKRRVQQMILGGDEDELGGISTILG